jgi:beta-glucanase (GH16 family)
MKVDTTPVVSNNRKSIRIQTNNQYTGGLFVLDAVHMPSGCGTWPAFWTVGPANWPANGYVAMRGINFRGRAEIIIFVRLQGNRRH